MKYKILTSIIVFGYFLSSTAQEDNEIQGNVVLQNSRTKAGQLEFISNVAIYSEDGYFKPQLTDSRGYFRLICSDKSRGEKIELKIEKKGYVLINEDAVNSGSIVGRKKPLTIVLSKKEDLQSAYTKYYDFLQKYFVSINERNELSKLWQKKYDSLQSSFKDVESVYENRLEQLVGLNQDKDILIEKMAREFAYTNLDDLSESYRDIYSFIVAGEFDKALQEFSNIDFESRFSSAISGIARNKERIDSLDKNNLVLQKHVDEDVKELLRRSQLKLLNNDFNGSIDDLQMGLKWFPDNIEYLMELGHIYQILNDRSCLKYYKQAFKHTTDDFVLSSIYNNIGVFYKGLKNYPSATFNLLKAKEYRKKLYDKNYAKGNYVHTLNNLSNLYHHQGEFKISLGYSKEALKISKSLLAENDSVHTSTYLNVLVNYSLTLSDLGQIEKVKGIYMTIDSLIASKPTYLPSPEKAVFYNNYGRFCFTRLDDNVLANKLYRKGIVLIEEELPWIKDFYSAPLSNLDYSKHIPLILGILYRNYLKTIHNNRDLKNECFIRAQKIYALNMHGGLKMGVTSIGSFLGMQLEYALFFLETGEEEEMKEAQTVMQVAKTNINQVKGKNKEFVDWGDVYRKIGLYHLLLKERDSTMHYVNLDFEYYDNLFNKKPLVYAEDLLHAAINLANFYIIFGYFDEKLERTVLKRLRTARRRYIRTVQSNQYSKDLAKYSKSIIDEYKNGIEFGELKEIKLQVKF
ncbi:MAG: tetratricopeptide repeat protein [Flavobacteriaceae bacterium]